MKYSVKEIWDVQRKFNNKFFKKRFGKNIDEIEGKELIEETKSFILHLSREVFEVLNSIPFKTHRSYHDFELVRGNIVEELIDVQKFLIGLFQLWGVDEEEFRNEFMRKSKVVEQRYEQEQYLEKLRKTEDKICILDIDGVLAEYPEGFLKYINWKDGSNFKSMFDLKNAHTIESIYKLKDEYRKSGYKKTLDVREGAKEFTDWLVSNNFTVVLLSARRYTKYFRIYADTLEWLEKNKIQYHGIIWDSKKDRSILKNFDLGRIVCMVEDNLTKSNKVAQLGVKVYLIDNIYNQGVALNGVHRIKSFEPIKSDLLLREI